MDTSIAEAADRVGKRHYWCFISYRHVDNKTSGREWATWLHHSLESYQVPKDLVGKVNSRGELIPAQIFPIFRDEEELAGGHLQSAIDAALENTRSIIVLCSPRTLESTYVDDEIRKYKRFRNAEPDGKKRAEPLAAILEGDPKAAPDAPGGCLPHALRYEVDEAGALTGQLSPLSLWIDYRADGEQGWTSSAAYREHLEKRNRVQTKEEDRLTEEEMAEKMEAYAQQLKNARLKLIAGILGVTFGDLQARDKAFQLEQARRRARNLRRWLTAVIALVLLAVVGLTLTVFQTRRAKKQTAEARLQTGKVLLTQAEVARQKKEEIESLFILGRAVGFEGVGKPVSKPAGWLTSTLGYLGLAPEDGDAKYPRYFTGDGSLPWSNEAYHGISTGRVLPFIWSSPVATHHSGRLTSVAYSPDGRFLASSAASNGNDFPIKLWDLKTGQRLAAFGDPDVHVWEVIFSPDGKSLTCAANESSIRLWSVPDGRQIRELKGTSSAISALAFSPEGKTLAVGDGKSDGTVTLWDLQSGKPKESLSGPDSFVNELVFHPDGRTLLGSAGSGGIWQWDLANGTSTELIPRAHNSTLDALILSPDGETLASADDSDEIKLWDPRTGKEKSRLPRGAFRLAFSPDGTKLASSSYEGDGRVWDLKTGKETAAMKSASCVAFSPGGETLAVGTGAGSIRLTAVEGLSQATFFPSPLVTFSPDGRTLLSTTAGSYQSWDWAQGKEQSSPLITKLAELCRRPDVMAVAVSASQEAVACMLRDATTLAWNLSTGQESSLPPNQLSQRQMQMQVQMQSQEQPPFSLAFSPDGRDLAITVYGETRLWELGTQEVKTLEGNTQCMAFSPDGSLLACGGTDFIRLWDVRTGTSPGRSLVGAFNSLSFSPDGELLAGAWADFGAIELFNVSTRTQRGRLAGLEKSRGNSSLAFSPDGRTLAAARGDQIIKLWDVQLQEEKNTLSGHLSGVGSVCFSPDGRCLASASDDGTVKLWLVDPDQPRARLTMANNYAEKLEFSPDGKTIAVTSRDSCSLWNVEDGRPQSKWTGNVSAMAFGADGKTLIYGTRDGGIKLRDLEKGDTVELGTAPGSGSTTTQLCVSPDGKTLAGNSQKGEIKLWDVVEKKEIANFAATLQYARKVLFSPDGESLAIGSSFDEEIKVFDVPSRQERFVLRMPWSDFEFSSGGQFLLTATGKGRLEQWDARTGARANGHRLPLKDVRLLDLCPGGKMMASTTDEGAVQLWDIETGEIRAAWLSEFTTNYNGYADLKFSPDGRFLAQSSGTAEVKLWDVSISRPELFSYVRDGWCRVEPEFRWTSPEASLFEPRVVPFRNVPGNAMLATLRGDFSEEEKSYQIYQLLLTAENWDAAALYYDRLSEAQKTQEGWAQDLAARRLGDSLRTARDMQLPQLASRLTGRGDQMLRWNRGWKQTRGLLLSQDGDRAGAAAWYGDINSPEGWRMLSQVQEGEEALATLEKLLKSSEADYWDFNAAGKQAAELGQGNRCREIYAEAKARFPHQVDEVNFAFGRALRILGANEEALPHLRAVKKLLGDQKDATVNLELAGVLEDLGQLDEAWALLTEVIGDENAFMEDRARAVEFALRHGRPEAKSIFQQLYSGFIETSPKRAGVSQSLGLRDYVSMGKLARDLQEWDKCRRIFQVGLVKSANYLEISDLHYHYGLALRDMGADEEAEAQFRSAVGAGGGDIRAQAELADLLDHMGKTDDARAAYQSLLRLPRANGLDFAKAGYFAARHGHGEWVEYFEKAESMTQGVGQEPVLRSKGWALLNLGKPAEALEAFQQAKALCELSPDDDITGGSDLLAGLAASSWRVGAKAEAIGYYRTLIAEGQASQKGDWAQESYLDGKIAKKDLTSMEAEALRETLRALQAEPPANPI